MERRAAETERSAVNLEKLLGNTRAANVAEQGRSRRASMEEERAAAETFMNRHLELRRAFIDHRRAQAASQFTGLFRELQLTPQQIERFKELATQGNWGGRIGPNNTMVPYKIGGDGPEAKRELQALLGDHGFRRIWNIRAACRRSRLRRNSPVN